MARKRDFIDTACSEWATTQLELNGSITPINYLGAVRCTLAERRDLHHGSRSGRIEQHWPEVHGPLGVCVSRAVQNMTLSLREILYAHYVVRAPIKVKVERLGLSYRIYWERLGRAKAFVDGYLASVRDDAEDEAA